MLSLQRYSFQSLRGGGEKDYWNSLPNPTGLLCAKALFWDEKRPPPVLAVPNKLVDVPVDVPNPKPVLVEDVAGWLNVLEPNSPPETRKQEPKIPKSNSKQILSKESAVAAVLVPGLACVFPKSPPVLLFDPKADAPNAPPLVVPKPVSVEQSQVVGNEMAELGRKGRFKLLGKRQAQPSPWKINSMLSRTFTKEE